MHAPWDVIVPIIVAMVGSQGLWQYLDRRSGWKQSIMDQLQEIRDDISNLKIKQADDTADAWRSLILQFDAEMRRDQKHTYEEFDNIIDTIDNYEKHCKTHPDYANTKATAAIKHIKEVNAELKETREYL